jgi:hypothetical protein
MTRARVQLFGEDDTFPLDPADAKNGEIFTAELPVHAAPPFLEIFEEKADGKKLHDRLATRGVREETTCRRGHQKIRSQDFGADVQPGRTLRLEVLVHTYDMTSPRAVADAVFKHVV